MHQKDTKGGTLLGKFRVINRKRIAFAVELEGRVLGDNGKDLGHLARNYANLASF